MAEWKDNTHTHDLVVAKIFKLSVFWDLYDHSYSGNHYIATVCGHRLKAKFATITEAKMTAENAFISKIQRAMDEMSELKKQQTIKE